MSIDTRYIDLGDTVIRVELDKTNDSATLTIFEAESDQQKAGSFKIWLSEETKNSLIYHLQGGTA